MIMRTSVVSLLFLAAAVPAKATEVPVFVIAGQSNAVGAGTSYQTLLSGWKTVQPNVLYSGPQESTVQWTLLTPPTQVEQMNYPNDPQGGFGPELTVGKTISDALGGQLVAETKYAVDGTNLYEQWNPNTQGSLYYAMSARVQEALEKLPVEQPGVTGRVAGFFWMQGESDALAGRTTEEYQADLTDLITHVRTDFGDPDLPFVFGRITSLWSNAESIRQAQANVAATVPYTYMFDTDSLGRLPDSNAGHYDNQGMIDLGIGFGNGYLATVAAPEPGTLAMVHVGAVGLLLDWVTKHKWRNGRKQRFRVLSVLQERRDVRMQTR
jgi:hypothetical protein